MPDDLMDQLLTWFDKADVWEKGYRLKPEYTDSDRNQATMVFGAHFTRQINRSLANVLDYMIKVAWTREHVIDPPHNTDNHQIDSRQIATYLGLDQIEKLNTISRRSVAIQRSRVPAEKGFCAELYRCRGPTSMTPQTPCAPSTFLT